MKKNILIIGAGDIGHALSKLYSQNDDVALISRKQQNTNAYKTIGMDYLSENRVENYLENNPLPDNLILTTGILHNTKHQPEKSITQFEPNWFNENLLANCIPSAIWLKCITPFLKQSITIQVACFSARVSSIKDNKLGGWHSYRMSKAALNMLVKNVSIEWRRKSPKSCVISYHPGTVDTKLSQPFLTHMKKENLFSPLTAAQHFKTVFDSIKPTQSGELIDWQGNVIPY